MRSFLVVAVACAFSVSACSNGSSGASGPPPPGDEDAALSEAGIVDGPSEDAEDAGLPGPTGPDDAGVDDSAPPAADGGVDGGSGEDAASADAGADGFERVRVPFWDLYGQLHQLRGIGRHAHMPVHERFGIELPIVARSMHLPEHRDDIERQWRAHLLRKPRWVLLANV